ncbi:serine hydrolase domain-containing protein [Streptomyces marianii]|uniref:Beta-lactamase family protein n=1 Tax=Streptomyces marianii TaxID=1817406 RepID=A0A5R9E3M5_9ACTN|nr:serine hydrolase domain-containing protein [Streptomyces marianii]TLQ42864.1 beta-lactamase family protein [Streptomyces marianii]
MEAHLAADRLCELAHEHSVPGAQLTVRHAGGSLSLATGVTRAGTADPVTTGTAFAFGSVTKAFTATLVAQLVSDGDLEWDDPVGEYLAEWDGAVDEAISSVTLRNLLSHTAGLVADHELDDVEEASLARYTASVATTRSLHEPGHCFSYSNSGYNILGRVIEAVTDMKWQAVMENVLLRPLGIDPVFVNGSPTGQRPLADGHAVQPGRQRTARPVGLFLPLSWAPASGLAGSADDLVALAGLHLGTHPESGTLLPEEQRAEMGARVSAADAFGMADGWGLGLAHYASADGHWYGHDGTVDGGTAHLRFHPDSGTAVALTTNATTGTQMWAELVDSLHELGVPVGDHRAGIPTAPSLTSGLDRFTGDYRNGDTSFVVRAHRGGGLLLTDSTGLAADVTLHDDLVFTARRTDTRAGSYTGRFVTDPATGDVTLMQLGGRSARRATTA